MGSCLTHPPLAAQHIASCMCVSCCQKGKRGVKQIYPSVKSKKAPQWVPEGVSGNQAHINWEAKGKPSTGKKRAKQMETESRIHSHCITGLKRSWKRSALQTFLPSFFISLLLFFLLHFWFLYMFALNSHLSLSHLICCAPKNLSIFIKLTWKPNALCAKKKKKVIGHVAKMWGCTHTPTASPVLCSVMLYLIISLLSVTTSLDWISLRSIVSLTLLCVFVCTCRVSNEWPI